MDEITKDLHPHHITDYAHKLAELMQKFCGAKHCKVLGSPDNVRLARLSLLNLGNNTLGKCLYFVGIGTLEKL